MESLLSALAFAGLIAAQFLSVLLVNTRPCEGPSPGTRDRSIAQGDAGQHLTEDPARSALEWIPLSLTEHSPQGLLRSKA
jgi:hypothetical protein